MKCAVTILLLCSTLPAADWPQWRGPRNDGVSAETALPLQWSAEQGVVWKVPLFGAGASAPTVAGGRVYVTASDTRGHDRLHVIALNAADGKQLWHTRLFGSISAPQNMYPAGGMAVPTVAVSADRVYALFGTGDLACLDLDGDPVWVRSLAGEFGQFMNRWGMAASPVLVGSTLLVQVDHTSTSYLMAVDAGTGRTLWKAPRPVAVNWSSPVVVEAGKRKLAVCCGTHTARAYDLADGREVWKVEGLQEQCIPSPVVHDGWVYAVSGRKGSSFAIKPDGAGDVSASHVVWKVSRGAPYVPSPVVTGGLYFQVDDDGIATCLDARTGELKKQLRVGGKFHASPVAGAGRLYLTDMEGNTTVIEAGPDLKVLARNSVGERVVASAGIANGRIFLRGEKHLFCIGGR